MLATTATTATSAQETAYPDLPADSVHHDAVVELTELEVMLGKPDGTFGPLEQLTRGQLASVVARAADLEPVSPTDYTDVAGSPHEGAIGALATDGIILGFEDGTFRPGDPIRRDHVALLLARWLELDPVAEGPFADVTRYAGEINALVELEVVRGTTETTFAPATTVRRDQTATMVANILRPVHLRVLYVNDLHGALEPPTADQGGAAYLAAYVDRYREEADHAVLVGGGDLIGGTPPISGLLRDEPTLTVLGEMGMVASSVGNHEFDAGWPELQRLIEGGQHPDDDEIWPGSVFPFLGANVIDDETGEPALPAAHTMRVSGIPVALLGVGYTDTPGIVVPGATDGLSFIDEVTSANEHAERLVDEGYEAIVLTAHLGGSSWASGLVDDIDVALGGHSHSRIDTVVDGMPVLQAGSNGRTLGVVDLVLDKRTRDVVEVETELVPVDHEGVTPNARIAELVEGYAAEIAPIVEQVVGEAATDLTRQRNSAGESQLGNLIADAQRAWTDADLAFMNAGGIRADLSAGEVIWGDLFTIQPFGNTLVSMTMTGDQVVRLLEQQWQGGSGMLQISGFTYTWDSDAPVGERVVEVIVDGEPIDADTSYDVVANVFLAGGGDGYGVFTEPTDQFISGNSDLEALVEFVEELPRPFTYEVDGRITRLP